MSSTSIPLTAAERESLWWRSVIGDAIYGLRHQPEHTREVIAQALVNALEAGPPNDKNELHG